MVSPFIYDVTGEVDGSLRSCGGVTAATDGAVSICIRFVSVESAEARLVQKLG